MEDNKPIDGAEYISLEDAKRLKLPYFEGLAAGYPSPLLHDPLERHTRGYLNYMNMEVTELHDEENLLVQMQDRWENYGSLDGIADTHDPFDLAGAPRFELYEKLNSLLNHALTADENLLLRQTLGMGCKQKSIKDLAQQMGTTQKAVQKQLVNIVEKLRHHDDSIQLWKYLNR